MNKGVVQKSVCDIIVPLWNKKDYTKRFVESIIGSARIPLRIIFVDNNSQDGTKEYLETLSSENGCSFEVITNNENEGFIKAVNKGLLICDADYICIANNDLEFSKGWIEEILSVFKMHPSVGLINPNSNNLGLKIPKRIKINDFALSLRKSNQAIFKELNFCIGFCMVTTKQVLSEVGFLSEDFLPMFFEDTDYSLRVQQKGYLVGVAPRSYVWHAEHASMNQLGDEKEEIFRASRKVFERKWGKILRVAVVCSNDLEIDEYLKNSLLIGRKGNYITFFVKNSFLSKEETLKKNQVEVFSNFTKKSFGSAISFLFYLIFKKKKYDIVITKNKATRALLGLLRMCSLDSIDFLAIDKIKRQGF